MEDEAAADGAQDVWRPALLALLQVLQVPVGVVRHIKDGAAARGAGSAKQNKIAQNKTNGAIFIVAARSFFTATANPVLPGLHAQKKQTPHFGGVEG